MKASVIKAPGKYIKDDRKHIFLAGSIDNGDAEDWQDRLTSKLADQDLVILNPRRVDWDVSWKQTIENKQFKEQVTWELDALEAADIIYMYFQPESKSPITLLELGLYASSGKLIIVSPNGYWRRGNIEVVSDRYNIPLFESEEEGMDHLLNSFKMA